MAGTKAGGARAAVTNKARHGADFYKIIGAKGGRNGHTGGFATIHECGNMVGPHRVARCAGVKGGRISRRTKGATSLSLSAT